MSSFRWTVLCFSMLVAEIQAALDSTITADLQPTIIDSLGEISKFPWINVTYALGLGGSCLLWYPDCSQPCVDGRTMTFWQGKIARVW